MKFLLFNVGMNNSQKTICETGQQVAATGRWRGTLYLPALLEIDVGFESIIS